MKKITLIAISFLVIINFVLLFLIIRKTEESKMNKEIKLYDYAGEILQNNIYCQQNNIGLSIPSDIEALTVYNTKKRLKSVFERDKKLLFIFSSYDCSQCIEFELRLILL